MREDLLDSTGVEVETEVVVTGLACLVMVNHARVQVTAVLIWMGSSVDVEVKLQSVSAAEFLVETSQANMTYVVGTVVVSAAKEITFVTADN